MSGATFEENVDLVKEKHNWKDVSSKDKER